MKRSQTCSDVTPVCSVGKTLVKLVYMLPVILSCSSLMAADFGTKQGTQWSPGLEWTIVNPTWSGNAFDVRAMVEFTHHPGGEKRQTEMFFVGEKSWAFRFTGTETGTWSFLTSCEDQEVLHGHTGKVEIVANPRADTHGFLKQFGNKWGWEGTENAFVPQLVMWDFITGSSSPRDFHNQPKLVDRMIEQFIVEHGFTGFHVSVIGGRWFNLEADSDEVNSTMTDPDPRTFEALEQLIIQTHAAGGMVHLWAWGDDQRSQTPLSLSGKIGGPVDQRLQRYIAARLGPIPGWSMGYGFDLDEWVTAEQVKSWRDSMHGSMGWNHFLGGRAEGPNHGVDHTSNAAWNQGLDYSSYEHHRPTWEVYRAALEAIPGRPVMSEDRFRVRKGQYPEKDYTEELTRRGLYNSTMAGGVANIWGIDPKLSPGGIFLNKEHIKTWSVFFNDKDRFLADMVPANELTGEADTRVLFSRHAQSLVLYRENTQSMQIDLTSLPDAISAIAVDCKKAYAEIPLGNLPAQFQTIQLPGDSDWIVAVGHFQPAVTVGKDSATGNVSLSFIDIWSGPDLNGGHGAMWADVDDDNLPDLYLPLISSGTLPDLFLHNKGNGRFAEEGARRGIADPDGGSHGAVWCDLDNDGDYDLINGTTFDDGSGIHNNVFRNEGNGNFVEVKPPALESRQEATRAFISFDMNGDGDLDLFGVSNYQGSADPPNERNEVYRNDGNFHFTPITTGDLYSAPAGQGATDTDFDGDGDIDVLAANRTGAVNILRNDGQGSFTLTDPASVGIQHAAEDGVTSADVDNDGDLDLLLTGSDGRGQLYHNDGSGHFTHMQTFSEPAGYMGGFSDLDNDGDLDLYFAGDTKVFLNNGAGQFSPGPAVPATGKSDPRGLAFADLDDDGDMDFAFGDKRANRNFIIRNDLHGDWKWLKIRLVASNGQAGAFGAKTFVYPAGQAGPLLGMRESQSNCGYLGQNDPVLHFGLAQHVSVDVVVQFLDGTTTTLSDVPVRQTLLIRGAKKQ